MLAYWIIFTQIIYGMFLKMESGYIQKKDGSKNRRSVTKGTIVLKMYPISKEDDREYIFIENDEVKDHYNRLLEKKQEEKKKAASCDTDCDTGCDCECGCRLDC